MTQLPPKSITLGITGASGIPISWRLIQEINHQKIPLNLIFSKAGIITTKAETGIAINQKTAVNVLTKELQLINPQLIKIHSSDNWFSAMASGSNLDSAMIICPCSMSSIAKIAHGIGDDLLTRAADVILKERHNLIIVPRETPLSVIHLTNMLKLARLGVAIVPPVPAFYLHPQNINDIIVYVVSRILDQLGIANNLIKRWASDEDELKS